MDATTDAPVNATTDAPANATAKATVNATAISAGVEHSMVLKTDGSVWATGENSDGRLGDGTNTDRQTFVEVMTPGQCYTKGMFIRSVCAVSVGILIGVAACVPYV